MSKPKVPQTFRCHITMKGERCPTEMTMANTFTYDLKTLDQLAERAGKALDGKFLAAHAICPWHGRYMVKPGLRQALKKDVIRMDGALDILKRRAQRASREKVRQERAEAVVEKFERQHVGRQPALALALMTAGIG